MVTIREIAENSGFSLSTVSIVLSGNGKVRHVAPETQDKILEIAQSMGYLPNVSARRLRSKNMNNMIIVYWASDYRAALVFRFLQGLYRYMKRQQVSYEVIIHPFSPGTLMEVANPSKLSAYNAGIVCTADEKDISFLENTKIFTPLVIYNRHSKTYNSVTVDNNEIGKKAAEIIWSKGKRKALAIGAPLNISYINERINAFITEFEKMGGSVERIDVLDNSIDSAYNSILDFDFTRESSLGIFCTSETLSMGVIKRINELGIDRKSIHIVQIAMLTKDISHFVFPDCTILEIPIEKMGYKCMETIDRIFKGEIVKPDAVKVKFSV
jgi:DNA-binding LacI/PurR family transcriptional regulator